MSEHSLLQTYQGDTILAQANKQGRSGMDVIPAEDGLKPKLMPAPTFLFQLLISRKGWNKEFKC